MRTLTLLCLAALASRAEASPVIIGAYTSSRYVTSIATAPDGSVWAATRGGVLWRDPAGSWRKFTVLDGLPSNEVLSISIDNGSVTASCPTSGAVWDGSMWKQAPRKSSPDGQDTLCSCVWRGKRCYATVDGLRISGASDTSAGMPPSRGSHISALLPMGDRLLAAVFGDGLWEYDGARWLRSNIEVPPDARDITALAASGSSIWIGARRDWLWEFAGGKWTHHTQPDEPCSANCQALARFQNKLYASTLEDGLAVRSADGWERVGTPDLSSDAPRQMAEFRGILYVRHGNGLVDSFDGKAWRRNVLSGLPRKQASCISASPERLCVGQWGGWSEFDGVSWTHHLQIPELQGVQVTAILPEGDRTWIGTQGRGLAEVGRSTGKLTWHDERHGFPDDWVKCLARSGDVLYAGTFVGGLACLRGGSWTACRELSGREITALLPRLDGGVIAAARAGVYAVDASGTATPLFGGHAPVTEAQALCRIDAELWIGTRTALFVAPWSR